MKKKQFLALALSAVMAGGMLAGCGSSNEAAALQRVMQKMKLLH